MLIMRYDVDEVVMEHLCSVFYNDLNLCGCGNPDSAWRMVYDLLRLTPYYKDSGYRKAVWLIGSEGAHHIVLSAMTHAELIEHGGGIGGSWITDKGRWFTAAIDYAGGPDVVHDLIEQVGVGLPHNGEPCSPACWTRWPQVPVQSKAVVDEKPVMHRMSRYANPYLVCDDCGEPVHSCHNIRCECGDNRPYNLPCGHGAGTISSCPTWVAASRCRCEELVGYRLHGAPGESVRSR